MEISRLEDLKLRKAAYRECENAILGGAQSYQLSGRQLTRANLGEIAEMIKYLEKEIKAETAMSQGGGRNKMFGVIPRDF